MKTMYALIIERYYYNNTHIYNVYESLYDAVIAGKNWIDDNLSNNDTTKILKEFADNDFMWLEGYFIIDKFEM